MEETLEKFKLGSKELNKELESKYYKFALNTPINIEVAAEQEIVKRNIEFEQNGEVKHIVKYDLNIIVAKEKKVWSVSNKVLTTIQEHIENTTKFKILLREKSYEVIPLGLKE